MKTFALAAAVTAVFITLLISPAQADPRADEAKTIVKTFALMGILVGIGSAVQIARLNAAVSGLGQLNM